MSDNTVEVTNTLQDVTVSTTTNEVTITETPNTVTVVFPGSLTATGYRKATVAKTSTYTATITDDLIYCDGTFTVTLPAKADSLGKMLHIKNEGTGIITVDGDGDETIDDETTQELYEDDGITIICAADQWHVV